DCTRFAYAIYLLNKDVEQVMQAYDLQSCGPSHILQNLYKLAVFAASSVA
ncbi:reverse transcriptase domain-containing protein, partial [Haematococcus lacustris]